MPRSRSRPPVARTLLALSLALASLQRAQAQDAPPADGAKLAPVVVTAERRTENIKEVPSSISTLAGETLDVINSGGQDIRMLSGRVPSLNIESSFGRAFPRFYIRGLGNTDFDLNASQPVSLVFDDVVQENPILKGFPLFDIERVEVLRGPQGTLFGRNSPAGVVKFDSVKPSQKQEGYVNATIGNHESLNLEGAYNLPLSGDWAARVSAQSQHRGDWVKNSDPTGPTQDLEGYDDKAARVQLLYQPRKEFSALLNVHGRDMTGSARLFRANIIQPGTNELVPGFEPSSIALDGRNEQKLHSSGANLHLRWTLDGVTLHSITGFEHVSSYSRGDIDGSAGPYTFNFAAAVPGTVPFPAESADGLPQHRQFTQELRLESENAGPLNWLAGVYYFNERLTVDSFDYATLSGGAQDGYAVQHQKNTAGALFGSLNYAVSERLKLRGGLRYTDDRKDYDAQRLQSPIGGGATGVLTENPRAQDTSWDLSGTYALNPDVNLYARVATGFRAPSIQGRLLFGDTPTVAGKEKVLSYEAGVKADLFDKRARLGFNVFQYTVKNQQLTAVGGTANFNQLVNAERTIGRGAELDLTAYLSDNLLVSLGASLNDTKIHDPSLSIQPCGLSGCTVLDPANPAKPGTVFIDGNPLPQAPKTVLTVSARYGIPTANGGEWFVFTDWAYRSKINFFLYESVEFTGKSLLEGGLRVGYSWGNGKYEAALFGRNITNQIRVVGGIDFNNLTGFINEPRMLGAQFKALF